MPIFLVPGLAAMASVAWAAPAVELAPDVYFIAGEFVEGRQPDGNSVLIRAPEGWIVVDTGRHREHTRKLLDLTGDTGKPLEAVINTHWHLDHIGGNVLIRQRIPDVRIYASSALEDAMTGFLADYARQLEEAIDSTGDEEAKGRLRTELGLIETGEQLAPHEVLHRSGPRTIAGRKLSLVLEKRAVTAGDIWVLDPATGILAAGDLVTLPVPFFDTACPERWKAALQSLSDARFTLLVPGHGEPMNREAFEQYRTAFDNLLACAASEHTDSECVDAWSRDADDLLSPADVPRISGMLDYYMKARLRADAASIPYSCDG